MGNSPSKNDALTTISSSNSGALALAASTSVGDENDELAPPLPRLPSADGSRDDFPAKTGSLAPKMASLENETKTAPRRIRKPLEAADLDLEISGSMARLLSESMSPKNRLSGGFPMPNEYGSLVESERLNASTMSPVFTTVGADDKDADLVLLLGSTGSLPTLTAGMVLKSAQMELAPIVERLLELTPEPARTGTKALLAASYMRKLKTTLKMRSRGSRYELDRNVSASSSGSNSPPLPTAAKIDINVDSVIDKLLEIGLKKPGARPLRLLKDKLPISGNELKYILSKSRAVFLEQPSLLRLSPPVKIVGDIHGQFYDLIRIFNSCGYPPYTNYLFLGDYVDRGYKLLETILLLLCYKIKYPENFFMLRGNHESANITKIYGFYDECKRRLPSVAGTSKMWRLFIDVFNTLPIAATINDKIFCIHGGLSPELTDLRQIEDIKRPTDIPDKGLLADLLWSDPDPLVRNFLVSNWPKNDRGVSYCFGKKHVDHFCSTFKIDLIVRGHMVVEDGYEFFDRRKLVTVFLAPNYCGEFNNYGAVMRVDKTLCCSFELLKPQ